MRKHGSLSFRARSFHSKIKGSKVQKAGGVIGESRSQSGRRVASRPLSQVVARNVIRSRNTILASFFGAIAFSRPSFAAMVKLKKARFIE